jgi:hypothetical protein
VGVVSAMYERAVDGQTPFPLAVVQDALEQFTAKVTQEVPVARVFEERRGPGRPKIYSDDSVDKIRVS